MTQLANLVTAWSTDNFNTLLKQALENDPGMMPLQQAAPANSYVELSDVGVNVRATSGDDDSISAELEVFFGAVPIGCACGEGPSVDNAYCELRLSIDKATGEGKFEITATGD